MRVHIIGSRRTNGEFATQPREARLDPIARVMPPSVPSPSTINSPITQSNRIKKTTATKPYTPSTYPRTPSLLHHSTPTTTPQACAAEKAWRIRPIQTRRYRPSCTTVRTCLITGHHSCLHRRGESSRAPDRIKAYLHSCSLQRNAAY